MRKFASLVLLLLVFCPGCSVAEPVRDTSFVMNTVLTQTYFGDEKIAAQNLQITAQLERQMSKTIEGSDIFILNKEGSCKAGADTAYVLRAALEVSDRTNGAFNPALNPIIELWGIGERESVPARAQIEARLPLTDYRTVQVDMDGTARLAKNGSVDLGGIAKGYALDKMADNTIRGGVRSALIDLGGSLAVIGTKPGGQKYKIGVRDPEGGENEYIATVELTDTFTSTSGVYEKYFIKDGVRYHHIMDPETGKPADNGLLAVMIVTGSGILSDAYSTALFVMGAQNGLAFAQQHGINALFIDNQKKITLTEGFAEKYALQLTDNSYEIV